MWFLLFLGGGGGGGVSSEVYLGCPYNKDPSILGLH